ncbi:MAG: septal ring lytic transglycosylase RlpA family protein [Bacteroidia bacterium]|nr:septal ring lytic transglycosylase RlpA family protein [Bacteroidia bacterium]
MKYRVLLIFCITLLTNAFAQDTTFVEYGKATCYHNKFEGRKTSNGERFTHKLLTAAHKTLPFNTLLKVNNLENNKSVIVRINDRMPKKTKAVLDLTVAAAKELGMIRSGRVDVQLVVIDSVRIDSLLQNIPAIALKTKQNKNSLHSTQ